MCARLDRTASDWAVRAWAFSCEDLCIMHLIYLRVCLGACFQGCGVTTPVLVSLKLCCKDSLGYDETIIVVIIIVIINSVPTVLVFLACSQSRI